MTPSAKVTAARNAITKPSIDTNDYELILRSIGEGVHVLDADGRITFVNPSASEMLGFPPQELVGQDQHTLIHHTRLDGSSYASADCPILAALRDGGVRRQDNEIFWRKDGTSFPVDYIATPIQRNDAVIGAVVAFRDVTERQRTARALALEQQRRSEGERLSRELQRVFMQVPAAVCITRGPDHIIEAANLRYQELVGRKQVVGTSKREVFADAPTGAVDILDRVYATGEPYIGSEVRRVWDRGAGVPQEGFVNVVYQPLRREDESVYGILALVIDVTELVQSRRLVEAHAEELNRASQSLSRINRELDQFAYIASHDLKAPLRGIASLATWIQEDVGPKLTDESRQHLGLLHSRIVRMEALIDGLLQYSRAGRVRGRVEEVKVGDLVKEVVDLFNPPAEATIEIAPDLPTLHTERLPLQQVFSNLIGNALKHAGRVDTVVRIGVEDAGAFYEFSVTDNGQGIPPAFHGKVWEIFQTLQPRDKVEGAGIGLALVKKTVESRGGAVSLDSDESRGAQFRFSWPKHDDEA